jgi:predicted RNase H-like HicB family nuclease
MKYPIAIEPGNDKYAFSVVVPDLPGCFSAGDTMNEAIVNTREAIALWLETVIEDDGAVPEPKTITTHQATPDYIGWAWETVTVIIDLTKLSVKGE